MSTAKGISSARVLGMLEGSDSTSAEHPQKKSTTGPSEVMEEVTRLGILNPSAENATEPDTESSGTETLEYAMLLPLQERRVWVARRLEVFRQMILDFANTMLRERAAGRNVTDSEAQAIVETNGLTRSIPLEREFLAWLIQKEDL